MLLDNNSIHVYNGAFITIETHGISREVSMTGYLKYLLYKALRHTNIDLNSLTSC
jgi:hypothetical protein